MSVSHSVWNENPTVYVLVKRIYSAIVTPIYLFAHYCVLKKSPKSFGSLKWIIYIHTFCITTEWLSNAFLIDIFDFPPSIIIRIDGFLNKTFSSVHLFMAYVCIEDTTATSALILFCSRLLMIANMYHPYRSKLRRFCEFLIYLIVVAFGMWSTPPTIYSIPEQTFAKITIQKTSVYYPDCLFDSNALVVIDPNTGNEELLALLTLVNLISIGIAIIASAKIAFWLMSRRMTNESEATKKMHQKFNQRTIFQAIVYLLFASIPFSALYATILFHINVPGLDYFIDFFSENHPTACVVTLFLYYDPYQLYLLQLIGWKSPSVSQSKHSTLNAARV